MDGHTGSSNAVVENIREDIRSAILSSKADARATALRLAWHASGTYDARDGTGGSDGATMRFEPESSDEANAGLGVLRDMLEEVRSRHPRVSVADVWILAGCIAVELCSGPHIPICLGRQDDEDGSRCPARGRLPNASVPIGEEARHLRECFYRMGLDDGEIVALSGGHTLGSCHKPWSGFYGSWTHNPTVFDNSYYRHLLEEVWEPRAESWGTWPWKQPSGSYGGDMVPLMYEDERTHRLMMLPTDVVLVQDSEFRKHVQAYANDQALFFRDFAAACGKVFSFGCPGRCHPDCGDTLPHLTVHSAELKESPAAATAGAGTSAEFRAACAHGFLGRCQGLKAQRVDVASAEEGSLRTGLHGAAFWGHDAVVSWLLGLDAVCGVGVDVQDCDGDTPLHDASRFGHEACVGALLAGRADVNIHNSAGKDACALAVEKRKEQVVAMLRAAHAHADAGG